MKLRLLCCCACLILAGVTGCGSGSSATSGSQSEASNAASPVIAATPVSLAGIPGTFSETFSEDFTGPLDVSPWGPGTRWIAHIPDNSSFGDATFINPNGNDPFSISDGNLTIEALQLAGSWTSGLLASVDAQGDGFSQQYGYFEMRAQLPTGSGTWPAFWLLSRSALVDSSVAGVEIDALEEYGTDPQTMHTNLHIYNTDGTSTQSDVSFTEAGMTTGFHTYGVLVTASTITYYFDRQQLRQISTPAEAQVPLYVLLDLAIDQDWPLDPTQTSASLIVDYVKVWTQSS